MKEWRNDNSWKVCLFSASDTQHRENRKKENVGAEASDEHDAELARHLLQALACKRPNPFLKTQENNKELANNFH